MIFLSFIKLLQFFSEIKWGSIRPEKMDALIFCVSQGGLRRQVNVSVNDMMGDTGFGPVTLTVGRLDGKEKTQKNQAFRIEIFFDILTDFYIFRDIFWAYFGHSFSAGIVCRHGPLLQPRRQCTAR